VVTYIDQYPEQNGTDQGKKDGKNHPRKETAGGESEPPAKGRRCGLKFKESVFSIVLIGLLSTTALAQTRGSALTLRFTSFAPIVSLAAGVLILIFPKLLRYIVGLYLILVGLLGLFGR
jgi:hypothetical protein